MLRTLTVLAILAPALALAQVTVVETSDFTNGNDEVINIVECRGDVRSTFAITWKLASTVTLATVDLRISDTTGCPLPSTTNTAKTVSLETFSNVSSGSVTGQSAPNLVQLLALKCDAGTLQQIQVCAVPVNGANDVSGSTQSAQIGLDTQIPTPPKLNNVTPGDGALDCAWDSSTGSNRYRIDAVAGTEVHSSGETTDTTKRITGLTNGTTYDVTVVGISRGGNESAKSNLIPGTPVEVQDFWRHYKAVGGREGAGCSLAALALALLALRRRS
jgi:hypothetical protein